MLDILNQLGQFLRDKTFTTGALTAGSVSTGIISHHPILNAAKERPGSYNDSCITFSPTTAFITPVKSALDVSSNGDYYINHWTGFYKVKSAANVAGGVTMSYYVNELLVYMLTDIEIGKVSIDQTTPGTTDHVSPISGQNGIAGGTGVDGATVPRVSLATNVPLPAGTNSLGKVTITPSAQATLYSSAGYAASGIIKGSAGSLYGIYGYNSKTSDQYIQIHNTTTLPADASVPAIAPILAPAQSNFFVDFSTVGLPLSTGIVWCNSSTAPTKTIGSADVFVTALYL